MLKRMAEIVRESLDLLIEELECDDITTHIFVTKIERLLGTEDINFNIDDITIAWTTRDNGADFHYTSPGHSTFIEITDTEEDGRYVYVRSNYDEEDTEEEEDDGDGGDEDTAEGCGDKSCESCSVTETLQTLFKGQASRILVSFGRVKMDIN